MDPHGQIIGRDARVGLDEFEGTQHVGRRADIQRIHTDRLIRTVIVRNPFYPAVMDIILIAGLWLPASIWAEVSAELETLGHRPIPISLPGVDDNSTTATLHDQLAAVLAAVDVAERPLVVGHSAASTLAWMVVDRRTQKVAGAVMVGGFPGADGSAYASFFPVVDGVMAFPGWEPFAGPDSADLDDNARAHIESIAVPVSGAVATATVGLSDDRRFGVPVVVVCPEFSPADAKTWLDAGEIPELERVQRLSFIDIDSGHWPMITRPAEFAQILHGVATGLS
jgi:pimeloyl-ACP methyl ester carboxylesterase